ncbi:MAG: hypothetical protein ABW321_36070 [Polyangiales bacterium]
MATRATRSPATPSAPRVLFICGTPNQTTQLHAVARELTRRVACQTCFTPFYQLGATRWLIRTGVLDHTILGRPLRERCRAYLREHHLPIDERGRTGDYDLVVTCTDLLIPQNIASDRLLVVQEGMLDAETRWARWVDELQLPPYFSGTTWTGARGRYARFCVASEGFRELLITRGAPAHKLRVTGIPNFDDCARFRHNDLRDRGYVLVCTSDLRETFRRDDRARFLTRVLRIAGGRPLHIKLHPNELRPRAIREITAHCPRAFIHAPDAPTEALIAQCSVLITQVSSVTFVGLALGKEVHSDLDLRALRRLMPLQNGGRSAAHIAEECRELLAAERTLPLTKVSA